MLPCKPPRPARSQALLHRSRPLLAAPRWRRRLLRLGSCRHCSFSLAQAIHRGGCLRLTATSPEESPEPGASRLLVLLLLVLLLLLLSCACLCYVRCRRCILLPRSQRRGWVGRCRCGCILGCRWLARRFEERLPRLSRRHQEAQQVCGESVLPPSQGRLYELQRQLLRRRAALYLLHNDEAAGGALRGGVHVALWRSESRQQGMARLEIRSQSMLTGPFQDH